MQVAKANQIAGIRRLCKTLATDYQTLIFLPTADLMNYLQGAALPKPFFKADKVKRGFRLLSMGLGRSARVCPMCLKEELPIPDIFNCALTICCFKHEIVLVDMCPACGKTLSYMRHSRLRCNCGFDLRKSPIQTRPEWLIDFYKYFAPWRLSRSSSLTAERMAYLEFMSLSLLRSLYRDLGHTQRSILRSPALSLDYEFIQSIVSNWPYQLETQYLALTLRGRQRFQAAFRKIQAHLPKLSATLGTIYKFRYLWEKLDASCRFEIFEKMIFLGDLSKTSGINPRLIRKLFDGGYFKSTKVIYSSGKTLRLISKKDAESFRTLTSSMIDVNEAADIMGCTPFDIRALIRIGFIKKFDYSHGSYTHARINKVDMVTSCNALLANARCFSDTPHRITSISDLAPKFNKWKRLIPKIVEGTIPTYQMPGRYGLGALSIHESDFDYCYPEKWRRTRALP